MDLQAGACYLVEEPKPQLAVRLLVLLRDRGEPCLVITRLFPDQARARWPLHAAKVLWIADVPGEDNVSAKAVTGLAQRIEEFVSGTGGRGVVLLDGFEYLSQQNGFDQALKFFEHVNEFIMPRRAYFLVPVNPKAFEGDELAMLERYVQVPDVATWTAELDTREWSRRLGG